MAQIKFKSGDKLVWKETPLDDTAIIDVKPQRVFLAFQDKDGKDCGGGWFSSDQVAQFFDKRKG